MVRQKHPIEKTNVRVNYIRMHSSDSILDDLCYVTEPSLLQGHHTVHSLRKWFHEALHRQIPSISELNRLRSALRQYALLLCTTSVRDELINMVQLTTAREAWLTVTNSRIGFVGFG
jgi:hypothetical protein